MGATCSCQDFRPLDAAVQGEILNVDTTLASRNAGLSIQTSPDAISTETKNEAKVGSVSVIDVEIPDTPVKEFVGQRTYSGDTEAVTTASSFQRSISSNSEPGRWSSLGTTISLTHDTFADATLKDLYELEDEVLGRGGFGVVRQATCKVTGRARAVKSTDIRTSLAMVRKECAMMRGMDHPNIIRLWADFEDGSYLHLVMEACEGGELLDRLQNSGAFNEKDARFVMSQALYAISYLHGKHIAHRDIKLDNFMLLQKGPLEGNTLKLIDFGFATECVAGEYLTSCVGSVDYMAPQVHKKHYDKKCDMWSLGVVAFALMGGYMPFSGQSRKEIVQQVCNGHWSFNDLAWLKISDEAKDFVRGLLQLRSKDRFSAPDAVASSWMRQEQPVKDKSTTLDASIAAQLRAYAKYSDIKKVVLMLAAAHADECFLSMALDQFRLLDKLRDGVLSPMELHAGLAAFSVDAADAEGLVKGVDARGNSKIDCIEFLAATLDASLLSKRYPSLLRKVFGLLDIDGDGIITVAELRAFRASRLYTQNPFSTEALDLEAEEVPEPWRSSPDGQVNIELFTHWLCGTSA